MFNLLHNYICSVRLGFATNSSSSHSILLVGDSNYDDDNYEAGNYNWNWFTLASDDAKMGYLAQNLYDQFINDMSKHIGYYYPILNVNGVDTTPRELLSGYCEAFVKNALDYTPGHKLSEGGVDHQSALLFPVNDKNIPDLNYIRWMKDIITDPSLVIFGDNDNEEDNLNVNGTEVSGFLIRENFGNIRVFDRENHWLLFKRDTGFKLRVSKKPFEEITYSNVPELVDIKITNSCSMGCTFCYQDSVPNGKHSSMSYYDISKYLSSLGVLEAAIGGGEPLEYPDFWHLISSLNQAGIVANITTRIPHKINEDSLDKFGGIGYSCESVNIAEAMFKKLGMEKGKYKKWNKKLVLHIVLGATPIDNVVELIQLANEYYLEVLLLSYKDVGRGKGFKPYDYSNIVSVLKEKFYSNDFWNGPKLGIDTPLVDSFGEEFSKILSVNTKFMSPGEGNFSLYIDFVEKKFGKSSYGDQLFSLTTPKNILETFNSWHVKE